MQTSTVSAVKTRVISYDLLRILSAFAVVMIHTSCNYVASQPAGSLPFFISYLLDCISHMGVPLFLMISGALMLQEGRDTSPKAMVKRAGALFGVLCCWSFFYAFTYRVLHPLLTHRPVEPIQFFSAFFMGHTHLWFLYMLIGLYLITPVLKLLVNREHIHLVKYFLLLSLLFRFSVPLLNQFFDLTMRAEGIFYHFMTNFKMDFVSPYITYYILGWYITNTVSSKKSRVTGYVLSGCSLLFMVAGGLFFIRRGLISPDSFLDIESFPMFFYSLGVFLLFTHRFENRQFSSRVTGFWAGFSKTTFGIYMMHPFFLFCLEKVITGLSPIPAMLLSWLAAAACSLVCTLILSKIPLFKKLVRY